jgi:sugar lactone lactonase YvrE
MLLKEQQQDQARALYNDYHIKYVGSFGEFGQPTGMDVDRDGTVFVSDSASGRMLRYGLDGNMLGDYKIPFKIGTRFAVAPGNNCVFQVDRATNTVAQVDYQGELMGRLRGLDDKAFQFRFPSNIEFDRNGCLWVCDPGRLCVDRFDKSGVHEETIEMPDDFELPYSIAFDETNSMSVTHYSYHMAAALGVMDQCKHNHNKYNLLKQDNAKAITKFSLPCLVDGYFCDICYSDGFFYLTDMKTLYKYDDTFSLIYKLSFYQAINFMHSLQKGRFTSLRIKEVNNKTYLYVLEIGVSKQVYAFEIE